MHRGHGSLDVGSLTPNGLGGNETRREKLFSSFFLSFGDTCRCHFFFTPRLPENFREIEKVNWRRAWISTLEL